MNDGPRLARGPSLCTRVVAGVAFAFALAGCDALDRALSKVTDRSEAFAGLAVGASGADRKTVIAAMGSPKESALHNVAGLEVEIMQFEDRRARYSVTLFNQRAWTKFSTAPSTTNTTTIKEK